MTAGRGGIFFFFFFVIQIKPHPVLLAIFGIDAPVWKPPTRVTPDVLGLEVPSPDTVGGLVQGHGHFPVLSHVIRRV